MTDRQKHFYKLYMSGYSMGQIARKYRVNPSTVCRTVTRAERNIRNAGRLLLEMKNFMPEDENGKNTCD